MKNSYRFYCNKECEFYPCHSNADFDCFNCMFCYCPLFALGDKCGGNFKYLEDGTKDCSNCLIPHSQNGYDYILSKYKLIAEIAKKNRNE